MAVAVRLTLKEFMESRDLKALQVESNAREKLGLPLGENTIYRMMSKDRIQKIDLVALNSILESLADLTGEEVQIGDILIFQRGESQKKLDPSI